LLGTGTVNVGFIRGGTQPNIVPDSCSIEIDRRTLPGETTGRQGLVARRFMVATAADRARAGALAAVLAEGPERVAQVALSAGALAAGPARVVLAAAATTSSLT